jgi:RimJ/RimL family protein N-acetyltransferase
VTRVGDLYAEVVAGAGVVLTPLAVADAGPMAVVLSDPALYRYTGGSPPSIAELEQQYRRQTLGPWPPDERWLNWLIRTPDQTPVGYMQATVTVSQKQAALAWVIGCQYQRRGYATAAAHAALTWLTDHGVTILTAHIRSGHLASEALAAGLGLQPTDDLDSDGERIWRWEATNSSR